MPSLGIVHRARRTMSETLTHGSRWRRVYRRATDECEVPPLDIGIQAIQLSPYRADVAGPCPTRLLTSPAFPLCSCSLSFQNQVRRVASESSALNSGPLQGRFTPCVPWRTVSLHTAPQHGDAGHAYLPGDVPFAPGSSHHGNVHVRLAGCYNGSSVDPRSCDPPLPGHHVGSTARSKHNVRSVV